ncbi:protein kinase family protein [Clostridium perfringens]|uniref:protein kinase family protein n=1 Tax=Clostridium perfringens TaxID=1502 RepID=UPI001ABADF94|nr:protein kinase family protein [Clostridium perfringens]MBO3341962.1 protein kinase family protein [Clostridium perfringens]MDK0841942.1 protein kinase family protein [Clostridium perfringens]
MNNSYLINKWNVNGNSIELKNGDVLVNGKVIHLNGYYIKGYIGKGDNGVILEVKEEITNQDRALKIWLPNKKKNKSNDSRGKAEIEKIAKLEHSNIVKYFHSEIIEGYKCCVMERINGVTLREYLDSHHPLLSERYDILQDIFKALRYSQEKGVYHGDLHLDNILIDSNKEMKILDYGTSIFSGRYSLERDSKLLYESTIQTIGEAFDEKIVLLSVDKMKQLSPNIVRIICKAISKITVLLDFSNYGLVDTIIEDIATIVMLVPFFDIRYLLNKLVTCKSSKTPIEVGRYFMKCLLKESGYAVDNYDMYTSTNEMEQNSDSIYTFYDELRNRFIAKISEKKEEKYIYQNQYQAQIFNGELYSKYSSETEYEIERKEIEVLIE